VSRYGDKKQKQLANVIGLENVRPMVPIAMEKLCKFNNERKSNV
jgi:hypothetical protein